MKKIAFYDTKTYDKKWFDELKFKYDFEFNYIERKLNKNTAHLASGADAVVIFVNDVADAQTINLLEKLGVKLIALRCAGFNNVDLKSANGKIRVARVPAYSPYAVAEYAMTLLLTLNRKTYKAYNRVRDYNFKLDGLTGFDLYGKTVGVVGTGKIGQVFIDICRGFKMNVIAFDLYPVADKEINYVSSDELFRQADIISFHCPLTDSTRYMVNKDTLAIMKDGVYIINTSRGPIIDTAALLEALKSKKVAGAGLDVYEKEAELFFEDYSGSIIQDDIARELISMPNVLLTSHQAFLTNEALQKIAEVTMQNIQEFFDGLPMKNEVTAQ
jgi:D-lactate dehydrogenase